MKHYLRGMTSVFRIFPAPRRITEENFPSFQDDAKALAGDWQRVGDYIRYAMTQEQEHVQKQEQARPQQTKHNH